MRAATEGHLPPVMPQGNLVEVLGRQVRKGSPGELMVESSPSRQRRPPCKTSKEMSDGAADAAALTYLLTYCAIHMYSPIGGKAPSVPLGASPCSPWEPKGAAPVRWCGARARVCLPVVRCIMSCPAGYVAGVSVSQCGVRRLGWLGQLGSCLGAGTLRPVWRAGFGATNPCPLAGAGGFAGPVWRACGPLRAPDGGLEEKNTGQCRSPALAA